MAQQFQQKNEVVLASRRASVGSLSGMPFLKPMWFPSRKLFCEMNVKLDWSLTTVSYCGWFVGELSGWDQSDIGAKNKTNEDSIRDKWRFTYYSGVYFKNRI